MTAWIRRFLLNWSTATFVLTIMALLYANSTAYRQELAVLAITYGFLAVGMYFPLALTGQLSLAYNAYFAIGAYGVVIWSNHTEVNSAIAVPLSVVLSMFAATVLGLATRRLSGFHLAVATLLFGVAARQWIVSSGEVTGGALGLGGVTPPSLIGWAPDRSGQLLIGALGLWLVCVVVSRIRAGTLGVALRGQQEAPAAAAASGFPPSTSRVLSLAIGAGIATLGGSMFAFLNGFVLPDSFTISVVFLVLFMPVLGGMLSPWGAVLGAVVVIAFTEGFDFMRGPGAMTFGVLTLVVLTVFPGGLLGLAASQKRLGLTSWRKLRVGAQR